MHRLSQISLPAVAAPAPLPTEGDVRRPDRALVLVDRQPETLGPSDRDSDGQVLELVPVAPESATSDCGPAGIASLRLSAQLYGQDTGPSQATTIDGHRDAPRIGAAAYRRASAESPDDPGSSVAFSIVV